MSAGAELSAAIESCLERITPANGFATDIKGVYGFGKRKPENAPQPALVVRVGEDQAVERCGNKVRRRAVYEVRGVFSRTSALQELQDCYHDILRSLGYGDIPPGRELLRGEIVEESVEYDPDIDGSTIRSLIAQITIQYVESY